MPTRRFAPFALLLLAGCNSTDPSLVPVSGTVTLDGRPLANATVTFIPKDGTPGFGGVGKTDAAGKYKLKGSRDDANGIPPGEYRVVISKRLMPDGSEVPAEDHTPPMNSPARESVPPAFSSMAATTLGAGVKPGGPPADFDLKSPKK
jgi:hypothetical protein